LWLHSLKVAQLLRSAACLHTNQSRSYLNHLVQHSHLSHYCYSVEIQCIDIFIFFLNFRVYWRKKSRAAELSAPSFKYVCVCVCVCACFWDVSRINNRVKQISSFRRDEDSAKSQHA